MYHCATESMQSTFLHKWNRQLWQEHHQFIIPFPSSKRDKKGEHTSTLRDQRSSCSISPSLPPQENNRQASRIRTCLPDQQRAGEQRSSPSNPASRGAADVVGGAGAAINRREALPQALSTRFATTAASRSNLIPGR